RWNENHGGPVDFEPDDIGDLTLRVPFAGQMQRLAENFVAGHNPATGMQVRYARRAQAREPEPPKTASASRHEPFVFRLEGHPGLQVTHALHLTASVREALVKLATDAGFRVPPVLHGQAEDGGRLRQVL